MTQPSALFINGVFEEVLHEIIAIQSVLPDHILFLQPFSSRPITLLQKVQPTVDRPLRLYMSLTSDLAHVHYQAEIVGWDDKRTLSSERKGAISRVIAALQPGEVQPTGEAVYNASRSSDGESVNLLHIRRLCRLTPPFSVSELQKTSDDQPLSSNRTQAGGWAYVSSK